MVLIYRLFGSHRNELLVSYMPLDLFFAQLWQRFFWPKLCTRRRLHSGHRARIASHRCRPSRAA